MAFLIAKQFFLSLILISLFLSSHARESRSFSKSTRTSPTNQDSPRFYPNTEKNYGLYATGEYPAAPVTSASPPPPYRPQNYRTDSSATWVEEDANNDKSDSHTESGLTKRKKSPPPPPQLPSNYKSFSYDTKPQGVAKESTTFETEEEEVEENMKTVSLPSNYNRRSYVTVPQGGTKHSTTFETEEENQEERPSTTYPNSRPATIYRNFLPQGMSDTRALGNGMFFYNTETGKFSNNHPNSYENYKYENSVTNRYDPQYQDDSSEYENLP